MQTLATIALDDLSSVTGGQQANLPPGNYPRPTIPMMTTGNETAGWRGVQQYGGVANNPGMPNGVGVNPGGGFSGGGGPKLSPLDSKPDLLM